MVGFFFGGYNGTMGKTWRQICRDIHLGKLRQPVIPQVQPTHLPAIASLKRGGATSNQRGSQWNLRCIVHQFHKCHAGFYIFSWEKMLGLKMTMAFETSQIMVKKTYQPQHGYIAGVLNHPSTVSLLPGHLSSPPPRRPRGLSPTCQVVYAEDGAESMFPRSQQRRMLREVAQQRSRGHGTEVTFGGNGGEAMAKGCYHLPPGVFTT